MKIYLNIGLKHCEQWELGFKKRLNKLRIPYQKVNILKDRIASPGVFIGRINEFGRQVKRFYGELSDSLRGRTWPSKQAMYYYDDKWLQYKFFRTHNLPTPVTQWVACEWEANEFIQQNNLTFPLVQKKREGSSSKKVRLVSSLKEIEFPCVLQEFYSKNKGDYRYTVIGDRIFGFFRHNRKNDFRASGSGSVSKLNDLDENCIDLVMRASRSGDFDCMAFDLVLNNEGKWSILEMSYTFRTYAVSDFSDFYYTASKQKVKEKTDPTALIVDNFLKRMEIKVL